jgi:glutamine phosphoribosylpyrophosphate amidotransferase
MCGVIGVWLERSSVSRGSIENVKLVERIFRESMIRGKHATGVSYVKDSKIYTIKEGIPCDEFLAKYPIQSMINEDGGIYLIGHIRYSTSDLRYNQPFSNGDQSIVHNGVISQEDKEKWKYNTETANDSELILKSYEAGNDPLNDFYPSSMAVCRIKKDKSLTGFRNEARPLWYSERNNGIVFASTKDILKRSAITNQQRTDMYVTYTYNGKLEKSSPLRGGALVRDLQCA